PGAEVSGFTFEGCTAGSGIIVSYSAGAHIHDNVARYNSWGGIHLSNNDGALVENNICYGNSRGIIVFASDNNDITWNDVHNNTVYGIITSGGSTGNDICNNTAVYNNHGIHLDGAPGNTICSNTIQHSTLDGVRLITASDNNQVLYNNVSYNGQYGLYATSSNQNTFSYNNVISNSGTGVRLHTTSWLNFNNNDVIANGMEGFYCYGSSNNTYASNYIRGNSYGIYLHAGQDNTVTDNDIATSASASAVYLRGTSGTNVSGNTLTASKYGVELYDADGSAICNNHLENNYQYGVYIADGSTTNTIHHNDFINNYGGGFQAYDADSNTWDTGYPGGGNYWDDHTSPDENYNGFVDIPYSIAGGASQDYYPYVDQTGWEAPYIASLRGQWRFNENSGQTALDSSLYGNDGQLGVAASVDSMDPVWVKGVEGSALQFDGVDDFVTMGVNAELDLDGGTIEFWVKPMYTAGSMGYEPCILGNRGNPGENTRYSVHLGNNLDRVGLWNGAT
ncbi:MAG: NosD domain-containing protein, partial [Candidatus Thermoplasmatota archaeon]|nr:NosD domain-containing protein [Candidatus Thermoplasmatota archaeon]